MLTRPLRASLILTALLGAACASSPPVTQPTPAVTAAVTPTPTATSEAAAIPRRVPRADSSLVRRKILFENSDRARPRLSPDGKRLAFLSNVNGVLNVWIGPAEDPAAAKPVTDDKKRGIREYHWAFTNDHVLYLQDKDGDENWHVFSVDLKAGSTKDLTPFEGAQARIETVSQKMPGEILVGLNDRDKKLHDLYRVNIKTGERKLVQKNDGFSGFVSDDDYRVRFALRNNTDGSTEVVEPGPKGTWTAFTKILLEDTLTTQPVGLDKAGKTLYLTDSRGRDTASLVGIDLKSKRVTTLAEDSKADISEVMAHPTTKRIEAVAFNYDRPRWQVLDPSIQKDFDYLKTVADGDMEVVSRTKDDKRWVVVYTLSDGPVRYYRYDRDKKKAVFLFTNSKALESVKLAKMHPVVIRSRDGVDLVSYLTLPRESDPDGDGRPASALPTTLLVHGGPWARDVWGFNRMHQWLASRGYAVLSVNYRGSTGFGKKFINASSLEWAGKMHDDLIDAVSWAVAQKVSERDKVAIMGGSYGGYATLVGLTFTPDTFACGVDIVGPSNLVTLLQSIPPYWETEIEQFTKRIGDHRTDEGRKLLTERSPLTHARKISKPLLIGQGANDPRVKQAESDQIVKAMQDKGIPVTYVLYPDEGHGFARPENRTSFNAVAEIFLAQCLGGPYEPVGEDFKGSSISVPAGKDQIFGVGDALP